MNKDSRFFLNGRRSWWQTLLNNFYAGMVVGRNAIILLITAFISWKLYDKNHFSITGYIQSGLPNFQAPSFSTQVNGTEVNFEQMFLDLAPGMVAVSLVGLMETVAVAKAFTSSIKLDATQEMIALGLCNIVGSFFGAFPAAGSFSRSAVNHTSGVKTTIGGCITGLLVIIALMTMSSVFELIPKAALAAIIIAAILPMIRFDDIWTIWKTKPVDIIPYIVTLSSSLVVGLEYGISIGVLISVGMLLYEIARPRVTIVMQKTPGGETFLCVKPDRNIYFPSVEYMKVKINKALPLDEDEHTKLPVVVDGEHVFKTDSTAVVGIKNMIRSFNNVGRPVIFYNLRRSVLRSITSSLSNRDELAYCKTELEVYAAIKFHKENGFITNSYAEDNHNHNERYWLTQSTEESTRS